jgi:hypothetical protein
MSTPQKSISSIPDQVDRVAPFRSLPSPGAAETQREKEDVSAEVFQRPETEDSKDSVSGDSIVIR